MKNIVMNSTPYHSSHLRHLRQLRQLRYPRHPRAGGDPCFLTHPIYIQPSIPAFARITNVEKYL
jgi:hypothetical protein